MSYTIKFTDFTNKGSITVNDSTINRSTSIGFPGRNQKGYGTTIAENFLHLLENFANSTPPDNPVEGQLWYDTSLKVEELKVYDGTNWKASGSLKKGSSAPDVDKSVLGDVWVDTTKQQLSLFNGSSWVLVGPTFSGGLKTGSIADEVTDVSHLQHAVIKNYVNDEVVSILSTSTFKPISDIPGFDTIKPGTNLSTKIFDTVSNKFWGVAEKAENLIIGSEVVGASTFLRSDKSNVTTAAFSIRNDAGLTIGGEAQLAFRVKNGIASIYHATDGSALDFKININGAETALIRLDATTGNVGIGQNNLAPTATLSVNGTGRFDGVLEVLDTTDSINTATGALKISGGAVISKKVRVGDDAIVSGQLYVDYGTGPAILPTTTEVSDIGSTSYKFRNVYSNTFNGDLIGNVTGNLTGNVNGTATSLISSTVFTMSGDISSAGFSFDGSSTTVSAGAFITGQQYKITTIGTTNFTLIGAASNTPGLIFTATGPGAGTGTATTSTNKNFVTTVAENFITTKTAATTTLDDDELLVYRNLVGLRKISKATLVSNLPVVPIGAIFPFAGPASAIPTGYLLCDGSEKPIGVYQDLYKVIGFTYTPNPGALLGLQTFKLPDLRGRFPLGLDNMDNADSVPNKADNGATNIDSGGGSANRVTDSAASTLGNAAGVEQLTLNLTQIPQHSHKLTGDAGGQYYVTNTNSGNPADTGAVPGKGPTVANQGQYLNVTGQINTNTVVGQPVNFMNPYLAINYIIYTGKVV